MPDYERQFRDAQALGWEGAYRATETWSRASAGLVVLGFAAVCCGFLWFGVRP